MKHRDPVTAGMRLAVLVRDGGCVAVKLGEDPQRCGGRLTLDHIKDRARLGKRAPSDMAHLVAICEAHSEAGARAGYQWNTAHRNELREYLRSVTP